jgi:hypothetical protein
MHNKNVANRYTNALYRYTVKDLEKKLECGNCPKGYVNCMPGTSKPDPYCSNKMLRQYCETMCGTKVAV